MKKKVRMPFFKIKMPFLWHCPSSLKRLLASLALIYEINRALVPHSIASGSVIDLSNFFFDF